MARLSLIVLFAQEVLEELVRVDTNTEDRWEENRYFNIIREIFSSLLKRLSRSYFLFEYSKFGGHLKILQVGGFVMAMIITGNGGNNCVET